MYRTFLVLAFPFLLLYALTRGLRDRKYLGTIPERFGSLPRSFHGTLPGAVWLHAVSVGEVLSAIELIRTVRHVLPGTPVFVSCTTLSGREAANVRLREITDGIFYAPLDYVWAIRRVLRRLRPAVVIVMETEIWPNLFREVRRSGAGLVIVNGRISDKALPSYLRWRRAFRSVLELPSRILVQSEEQKRRYVILGAPEGCIEVAGNLKHDFDPDKARVSDTVLRWLSAGTGPLWVAASTVAPEFAGDCDEDDAVLAAWARLRVPGIRLVLAPRKPERFPVVADKLKALGLPYARRSTLPEGQGNPVLLLDSIGELAAIFRFADVVFMGGTLAHRGGHNLLEPAVFAKPITAGPHLENFAEIQAAFRAADGYLEISEPAELAQAVERLLGPEGRAFGERAHTLALRERGAADRAVAAIATAYEAATPRILNLPLSLLASVWVAGGLLKRRLARPHRLPAPVISVGALVMGGAGKTPLVRAIARDLAAKGKKVAILTRGYRRVHAEPVTVLPRGSVAPVSVTGDEAQMLLRDGTAVLGIGSDRAAAGIAVVDRTGVPDVFLLDDGFQHARVARDLDIVVLDGMDPFAGGGPFPLGRLREPLSALRRAQLIVISRSEGRRFRGVLAVIRRQNAHVPVLCATTQTRSFIALRDGRVEPADEWFGRRVVAFCGLGSPEAFRETLVRLGIEVEEMIQFPDHHRYEGTDIANLKRKSGIPLVTTEKDAVKLMEFDLDCWYLQIDIAFESPEALWKAVTSVIQ